MGNISSEPTAQAGPGSREEDLEWLDRPLHIYDEDLVDEKFNSLPESVASPARAPAPRRDNDLPSGATTGVGLHSLVLSLAELVEANPGGPAAPPKAERVGPGSEGRATAATAERLTFKRDASNWETVSQFPDLQLVDAESQFVTGLHKRCRIYRRIYEAVRNEVERARAHHSAMDGLSLLDSRGMGDEMADRGGHSTAAPGTVVAASRGTAPQGNIMMAAAIRLVLSLASEFRQTNNAVFTTICVTLMELLQECSHLALEDIQATSVEGNSLNRILTFAMQLAAEGNQRERYNALSLLIGFAISTGSVSDLIFVVRRLLAQHDEEAGEADREGGGGETGGLDLLPPTSTFLQRLAGERVKLRLTSPSAEALGADVPLKPAGGIKAVADGAPGLPQLWSKDAPASSTGGCSVAGDGKYLYVWTAPNSTLHKVGTGYQNTELGKIYASNSSILEALGLLAPIRLQVAVLGSPARDVTAFLLATGTPMKPVDLRPLLDAMLSDPAPEVGSPPRALVLEYAEVVQGSQRRVVRVTIDDAKIEWPPPDFTTGGGGEFTCRILWAFYGTLIDVTSPVSMRIRAQNKTQVTLNATDILGSLGRPPIVREAASLLIRYTTEGDHGQLMSATIEAGQTITLPENPLRKGISLNCADQNLYLTMWTSLTECQHVPIRPSSLRIAEGYRLRWPQEGPWGGDSALGAGDFETKGEPPLPYPTSGAPIASCPVTTSEGYTLWSRRGSGPQMQVSCNLLGGPDAAPWVDLQGYDGQTTIEVSYPPGALRRLMGYSLQSSSQDTSTDPRAWRLEGFDGRLWRQIDRVGDHLFTERLETATFWVHPSRVDYYASYRFVFDAVRNPTKTRELSIGRLRLLEQGPPRCLPCSTLTITDGQRLYQLHQAGGMADLALEEIEVDAETGIGRTVASHPLYPSAEGLLGSMTEDDIRGLLGQCSAYTNGHELVLLCRGRALSPGGPEEEEAPAAGGEIVLDIATGQPTTASRLEGTRTSLASHAYTYDATNNIIWSIVPQGGGAIRRWRNQHLAPRFRPAKVPEAQRQGDITSFSQTLEHIAEGTKEQGLVKGGLRQIAIFILANIDRISSQYDRHPSDTELRPTVFAPQRRKAFTFELRPETFGNLLELVKAHLHYFSKAPSGAGETGGNNELGLYVLVSSLRILRVNIYQLIRNGYNADTFGDESQRSDLLNLLMGIINGSECAEGEAASPVADIVVKEALELFVRGIDIFYPTGEAQARLLASYLKQYSGGVVTKADGAILSMLLGRLRDLSYISTLVEGNSVPELMSVLMELSVAQSLRAIRALRDGGSTGTPAPGSQLDTVSILDTMQRYIFTRACEPEATASDTEVSALTTFLTILVGKSRAILKEVAEVGEAASMDPAVESILLESVVGRLLAPSMTLVWMLAQNPPCNGGEVAPVKRALIAMAPALGELIQLLSQILKLLSPSQLEAKLDRHVTKIVTTVLESEHDYRNNMHDKIKLHIPHASRMTIVFTPETSTEQSYDYVRIFKDEDMTETWHVSEEKFSGPTCWPGKSLPPLEIPSDTAWILWHTDGSNVDW
jgi:hypothetical protein